MLRSLVGSEMCIRDRQYTVPIFGFESSEDYWIKASSKPYIPKIKLPALLINSKDDTFLAPACFPIEEAKKLDNFFLMMPNYGGHVGFISSFTSENRWVEHQMIDFITKKINITPNQQ